jgi:hypothetical protein
MDAGHRRRVTAWCERRLPLEGVPPYPDSVITVTWNCSCSFGCTSYATNLESSSARPYSSGAFCSRAAIWMAVCFVAAACGLGRPAPAPSIEFSTVPAASGGGSEKLALIAGRATGARPGEQIVLFAKSSTGVWWVQPLSVQPFTTIESDSTWKSTIHLGIEYAALLVRAGYQPPATTEVLPKPGGDVVAVATTKGTGVFVPPSPKLLTFSGYEWEVRQVQSDRGGANDYDPENAWTDGEGLLHLALRHREGRWTSAEVVLTHTLGYGTYAFVVRDTSRLDPAAAIGMYTWDDQGADQNHRELDVEISQWGDSSIPNAQFVVQPYYVPANVARFASPSGRVTHSFRWEPGRALFRSVRGSGPSAREAAIAQHEFTSGVPVPGDERVRISLYYFRYAPSPPENEVEVILEKFQYFP